MKIVICYLVLLLLYSCENKSEMNRTTSIDYQSAVRLDFRSQNALLFYKVLDRGSNYFLDITAYTLQNCILDTIIEIGISMDIKSIDLNGDDYDDLIITTSNNSVWNYMFVYDKDLCKYRSISEERILGNLYRLNGLSDYYFSLSYRGNNSGSFSSNLIKVNFVKREKYSLEYSSDDKILRFFSSQNHKDPVKSTNIDYISEYNIERVRYLDSLWVNFITDISNNK